MSDSEDTNNNKDNNDKQDDSRRSGGSRRDDFDAEVIDVRRVTRVIAGGRRFSFRVAAVAGDHQGKVGVGLEVSARYNASEVNMHPAPGRGLVSGSSVRDVIRLAGLNDVSTKLISRTKNKLNNARAAVAALDKVRA